MTLGVLWLTAGLLQLQPFMFTSAFAQDVLGSAAAGQPTPLAAAIDAVERVVQAHPAAVNWPFALLELAVGAGLVLCGTGRAARRACLASACCGLAIWLVGEGAGGLLTGHAAASTGAPGAALVYAGLSLAAWPVPDGDTEAALPAGALRYGWAAIWVSGAALATLPAERGANGLGAQAAMGWMMSPSFTVRPARDLMLWLQGLAPLTSGLLCAALVVVQLAIGAGTLSGRFRTAAVVTGTVLALAFWVFGQGFGGLSTGTATDMGTGPLIVLVAVAVLMSRPRPRPAGD